MCRNLFLEETPCGVILISNVSGCLWEVWSPVFFNDILTILLQFFENNYYFVSLNAYHLNSGGISFISITKTFVKSFSS